MPNAITIFETKLTANSFLNLNFPNYKFICNDFITHAGGAGLYIKAHQDLAYKKTCHLLCNIGKIYGSKLNQKNQVLF